MSVRTSPCRPSSRRTVGAPISTRQATGPMPWYAAQAPGEHRANRRSASRIEEKLLASGVRAIASTRLGEFVMRELKRIDKVAYVRFASVYRSFEDVDEFRQLIREI